MRLKISAVILVLLGAISAMAQTATVKGDVKDQAGPVVGAQVLFKDAETGRKYSLKTDKKGQYFSIGVAPGKYDVTVTRDGKQVFTQNGFPVTLSQEVNQLDVDLTQGNGGQPVQAAQGGQQQQQQRKLTEEEKKQQEEIQKQNAEIVKQNAKIGGLNNMLKEAQADMQGGQADAQAAQVAKTKEEQDSLRASSAQKYDSAARVMEQAEQADNGQHDQILGVLGSAYLADKKYPEAIDALNKAIQAGSTQTRANVKANMATYYDNLAQAYAKTGKIPEAIDAYNKEVEHDPNQAAQAYYNQGAVLTNAGKTDDANAAFTKAIQTDPNKADAYYQRAINSLQKATVDKTGKMVAPPGTVEDFNKYLELQPNGPNAEAAKSMLDTLGAKVNTGFKKSK